jgi:hypothetical protein
VPTTLGEALAERYVAEGLPPDGGASQSWFRVYIGPLTLPLPNPPARKQAVFFHDATHVLTGYNTVFSRGEMEIAGYEIASGCGRYGFAWLINLDMFALGLAVLPRSLFAAFVRGRRASSLYRRPETRAELSGITVADLRTLVRLDQRTGNPRVSERVCFGFWSSVAVATILAPVAIVVGIVRLVRAFRAG